MTDYEALDAIQKRWLALWPALSTAIVTAGVATMFENEAGAEPAPPAVWCMLVTETQPQERMTMGRTAKYITRGTIFVRINYPAAGAGGAADGMKLITQLAGAAKDALSVAQFGEGPNEDGVITREGSIKTIGEDGLWWMIAVLVPFEYTEIR